MDNLPGPFTCPDCDTILVDGDGGLVCRRCDIVVIPAERLKMPGDDGTITDLHVGRRG